MAVGTLALAAIAVAVSLFSLLLNLGVVRRLREYSAHSGAFPGFDSGPRPGAVLPDFTANTTVGSAISATAFANGDGYIAFLSASCEACKSQFPLLAHYADAASIDRLHSLVVVAGDPRGDSLYARDATRFAQVVLEDGSLVSAFDIRGFPTLVGVRDGRVVVSAPLVEALYQTNTKQESAHAGSARS